MSLVYADSMEQPLSGPIEVAHRTAFVGYRDFREAYEARGYLMRRVKAQTVLHGGRQYPGVRFSLRLGEQHTIILAWIEEEEEEEV